MFLNVYTMNLLPFASLSGFLYDRQFFQGENAAGIYPVSAYYAANITLEVLFNSINAMIFATITYNMTNYQAFIGATSYAPAVGYVGIVMIASICANVSRYIWALVCALSTQHIGYDRYLCLYVHVYVVAIVPSSRLWCSVRRCSRPTRR